jgi:hypothetical protein
MAKGRKTGGRTSGTPNKDTAPIRDVLHYLGTLGTDGEIDLHAERLHKLTLSEDEHVAIKALGLTMAYRHGKPTEHIELGGEGGGPVRVKFVDVDV